MEIRRPCVSDASGSVTGTSGRYVVAYTPFLAESGCDYRPHWNAHSCPGPYIRLYATFDQDVAPARVMRDDGAFEDFVGAGNNPSRLSMSLIEGRSYDLGPAGAASNIEIRLLDALAGHSVSPETGRARRSRLGASQNRTQLISPGRAASVGSP
jgi:hypothetical protein